jgi:hypothetical protein
MPLPYSILHVDHLITLAWGSAQSFGLRSNPLNFVIIVPKYRSLTVFSLLFSLSLDAHMLFLSLVLYFC